MNIAQISTSVQKVATWNPQKEGSGSFTYVDLSSVDQRLKAVTKPSTVVAAQAPSRARQLIEAGDVLVSTVRPNLNAVAYVPSELDGATASTGFCVLRPQPGRLDGRYLFHWVRTQRFVGEMVSRASGASYPAISDKIVKGSPIPLPSIEEQRRIAAVLDRADAIRLMRSKALAKLDTLTQSVFASMFGSPIDNPHNYRISEMIDLVDKARPITYGILKPGDHSPGGVPYVRVVDMVDGSIDASSLRRTTTDISQQYKRSLLREGDVLMSIRGHVGRLAIVEADIDGANITQDTARLAISGANPIYVLECLRSPELQRWMSVFTKGAAVRGINLTDVKKIPIPVPPRPDQDRFADLALSLRRTRLVHRRSAGQLDGLFASLQQRAFRGEL